MSELPDQRTNDSSHRISVEWLAPAKINLFLHVTGRRPDGYHELYSLMCPVALYDKLVVTMGTVVDQLVCDHPDVPSDNTNLALKAVTVFNEALADKAVTPSNLSIRLFKQIPVGAGLGGGSSDAAAVLNGLNRQYGAPFDRQRLHAMAIEIGADVPFFIDGRPALARGIGEQLTPYNNLPPMWAVLVYPGFGINTAQVFKNLNLGLTKSKKKLRYFPFINGKFSAHHDLHNDLETALGDHSEIIQENKDALISLGADYALMTGSGSTVFGLFSSETAAKRAQRGLLKDDGRQVYLAALLV